ncbi:MAG: flagellar export chaperone FlgN [Verrucomicrobiae bacterium]|nr:flagellar export chaperone FlgN [Verrucomicrobiae bacterium]
MREHLEALITALRAELTQYGELLALLDQQQQQVMAREADETLRLAAAINHQSGLVRQARDHRDLCRRQLARALGLHDDTSLTDLLPRLPEEYRLLVQALLDENNRLLVRVQQRARQNHLLLARTVELMRKFIESLLPSGSAPVYDQSGRVGAGLPGTSLYEAVG